MASLHVSLIFVNSQFYAKDSPVIGCINRSSGPKTLERITSGDQRTMLLSTLVLLHGEHYIKNHVNKHVKKMEIYDSCLSCLKRSSMEDR